MKATKGSSNAAWIAAGRRNLEAFRGKNHNKPVKPFTSETGSQSRRNQLAAEEAMAAKLREEGYKVFSPTVVCDRVAIKDGKVLFVEFKRKGQKLRPSQQEVHDVAPSMYLIRYE
jgi:hypothetical protein